jgi:hypothetical protein
MKIVDPTNVDKQLCLPLLQAASVSADPFLQAAARYRGVVSDQLSPVSPELFPLDMPVPVSIDSFISRNILLFILRRFQYQRLVTGLTDEEFQFDSRQGQEIGLFSTPYRWALWSTQPPIQWVLGAFSLGAK